MVLVLVEIDEILLLIEESEEIVVYHLEGTQVLLGHAAYLVGLIGLCDFNRQLIKLLLCCFLNKVNETKVVEALLEVVCNKFEVLLSRCHHIYDR